MEELEKFKNNSQFINDIPHITEYIKDDSLTTLDVNAILMKINIYNNQVYTRLKKQVEKYKKVLKDRKEIDGKNVDNLIERKNIVKESVFSFEFEDQSLKIDISFYLDLINECDSLDDIVDVLPTKETDNCFDIINLILLDFIQDQIIIKRLLKEEDSDTCVIDYYNSEYDMLSEKISIIKNYLLNLKVKQEVVDKKNNNVIFLTTKTGNVCFESDINRDLDKHYYNDVIIALESIKNGTFKGVKKFNDNEYLRGLCEVRSNQIRIAFTRVNKNTYVVTHVFDKKCSTSSQYKNALTSRYEIYKNQESKILECLNNTLYLDHNETLYEDFINYLENSKKGGTNGKVNRKDK